MYFIISEILFACVIRMYNYNKLIDISVIIMSFEIINKFRILDNFVTLEPTSDHWKFH